MTYVPGQDGRMDFADLSDDRLHARAAELRAQATDGITQAKAAGPQTSAGIKARDRAASALTLAKAMDAELRGRAQRALQGQHSPEHLRAFDLENGTFGEPGSGPGLGIKSGTRLTRSNLRDAAAMAVRTGFIQGGQKALAWRTRPPWPW